MNRAGIVFISSKELVRVSLWGVELRTKVRIRHVTSFTGTLQQWYYCYVVIINWTGCFLVQYQESHFYGVNCIGFQGFR